MNIKLRIRDDGSMSALERRVGRSPKNIRKILLAGSFLPLICGSVPALASEIPDSVSLTVSSKLSSPTAVAVDGSGWIYVTESRNNRLLVYDSGGEYIKQFKGLNKPTGVAADASGRIYICNTGRKAVDVFDKDFTPLFKLGHGVVNLVYPVSVAVDGAGNAFVADGKDDRIKVFDRSGAFLYSFGGKGTGDGALNFPVSVAFNETTKEVVVTDLQPTVAGFRGAGVQVFSREGAFRRRFGGFGEGEGRFIRPMGVAVDRDGRIYVADAFQNVVQVFDANGTYLKTVYDRVHPVRTPLGIAYCGKTNRLFVASLSTSKVEIYGSGVGGDEAYNMSFSGSGGGCSVAAGQAKDGKAPVDFVLLIVAVLAVTTAKRFGKRRNR
jgi:sugar lactone lactonase YvrE